MFRFLFLPLFLGATLHAQWERVDPPARGGSGMPFLTMGGDGAILLSWLEPDNEQGHALKYSRWRAGAWSGAETISSGRNWFVNWADFSALAVAKDGSMFAHWLARADSGGKYGYGIRLARKGPSPGDAWRQVAAFNERDPDDYAGFLSFAGTTAAYLSPPSERVAGGGHDHEGHRKTLRLAEFASSGELKRDFEIDGDVCSCCQTASAVTPSGLLIAYRDHLPGEIRDISIIRVREGRATPPAVLHRDGWQINGCPTEGPAIAVNGRSVAIAWMTRANDTPRLQLAWSRDGGESFRAPVQAHDGNPLGRPNLAAIDEREFVLVWLERTGSGAEVRLRTVRSDGWMSKSTVVAKVAASRATGLPKVAVAEGRTLVVWRDESVRAAWISTRALPRQ
ncbi:MAG: hypothetical protein JNL98_21675 [Bryobacterales bacterium]|nr:hypothetical protein [Bryobacterales bacterium]